MSEVVKSITKEWATAGFEQFLEKHYATEKREVEQLLDLLHPDHVRSLLAKGVDLDKAVVDISQSYLQKMHEIQRVAGLLSDHSRMKRIISIILDWKVAQSKK